MTINGNLYTAAFLPNHPFYPAGAAPPAVGGMDEQYDIPNWDNMFLAFVPPSKMSATVPSRVGNETTPPLPILPSFHRPDLVRFWENILVNAPLMSAVAPAQRRLAFLQPYGPDRIRASGDELLGVPEADELVAIKRMFILRPLREDHPNFTGGNSNFLEDKIACYNVDSDNLDMDGNNATGADQDGDGDAVYDVDNDGDGIAESIWIDPGLPVVTAPNGRRYKRLVAICIKDLDGRVNPNVHGNLVLANSASARTAFTMTSTYAGMDPSAPTGIYLPRGQGFGPAEVDFQHILLDDVGVYNNLLGQRYLRLLALPNTNTQVALPGFSDGVIGNFANHDGWSHLKMIGMPGEIFSMGTFQTINNGNHTVAPLSGYSMPPDVWGRGAMAVDHTGQPLWNFLGIGERVDNPYEVQWDPLRASVDAPYTVSELEALLRYHDQGAAIIPSRFLQTGATGAAQYLATEARGTLGISQIRREAFGLGSHIPAPRFSVPRELRTAFGAAVGNSSILDLYFARLGGTGEFQTVVPFEFLKGQLFNLNRELGNGVDDNGNGVVDEPAEFGGEMVPTTTPATTTAFNYLNDTPATYTTDQRQMFARHLYCLAMFLRNTNNPPSIDFDSPPNGPSAAETARYYAQWAINVVDFRDPDSIMTPFEYDINPNNGWTVDGALGSADDMGGERGLVWGCERPELLITETANLHDRRTEDLDNDQFGGMNNGRVSDPTGERDGLVAGGTNDFDQRLRPQGATFIELYNPWYDRGVPPNQNLYDHKPAELYTSGGVDIARVNGAGWPVWRMLVVNGTNATTKNQDPDYPGPEAATVGFNGQPVLPGVTVERSIYFADLDGGASRPAGDGEAYFPSSNIFPAPAMGSPRIPPIMPGRYAVLGSAGYAEAGNNYSTNLGWRTTEAGPPARPSVNPRKIILNPVAQTVRVTSNIADGADDVNGAALQSVVAIPIDYAFRNGAGTPQALTISEPVGDYPPQPGYVAPTATEEGYYAPPIDAPFDFARTDGGNVFAQDQTSINYRALHLQRLANPLIAWDPVSNPYMTVDTSSMDVMSYNGCTDDSMDPQAPAGGLQNFQSFQRGGRFYDSDTPEMVGGYTTPATPRRFRELWSQESPFGIPTGNSPTETTAEPHFSVYPLYHTLGGLNRRFYPYFGAGAPAPYPGAPYFQDATGATLSPFPYFAFNNRPFNNVMELLQVPAWQSSKVLEKFDGQYLDPTDPTPPWTSQYQVTPGQTIPYGHLPNFFFTTDAPDVVGDPDSPELSRILDYLETRTPYIDTEKYYRPDAPANFATDPATPAGYRPPYNYLSRFREPGRININTIFHSNVWDSAVRGFPGMCTLNPPNEGDGGLFLTHLILSRQGYGTTGADVLQHNPLYPSLFSNPFRTADSADMMPLNPNAAAIPPETLPRKSPADGGLLRRDLNQYPSIDDADRPLFGSDNTLPYQDSARNPYFRYQGLQKIGNVFSTNSNVFAVWITTGYFEVEGNDADNNPATPFAIDAAHPDGLRLAQEVGADSGEVKRHRAFYIIDRSIPVGYEPGHRHNTDKAILLKRFIE